MKLTMAHSEIELGGASLGSLREANALLSNPKALQDRMEEDGYLLLRGIQNPETVATTRRFLLKNLAENDQIDLHAPLMEGVIKEGSRGAFLGGSKQITRDPAFLNLVESPEILGFFSHFLQAPILTFDYKWLRVVGHGDFTGAHYDIVYMGRGTQNLYTCWTPIGDISYDMGPLAMLVGSHQSPAYQRVRETYGAMDVDRDRITGWFSNNPYEMIEKFGGKWETSEFKMGDVLIFGMYSMHASLTNISNRFRLTADTRYQRADEPADERWVGENPIAHYGWFAGETESMEDARKRWNI